MKLYNSIGPNPLMVRMFIAEKGLDIPMEDVDIMAGVNRQSDFLKVNPTGSCPALVTDSGDVISEVTVISEYLDSMERLLQLKTDEVRPGHYHSFDRRRLTELVKQYIDTRKAPLCPSEK